MEPGSTRVPRRVALLMASALEGDSLDEGDEMYAGLQIALKHDPGEAASPVQCSKG